MVILGFEMEIGSNLVGFGEPKSMKILQKSKKTTYRITLFF